MKKEYKILLGIFLFALIIRIIFVFASPVKIWDETVYANLGYDLNNNPLDYSVENNGWSDFIPQQDGFYGWPNMGFRAPLLPYILSSLYFLKLNFLINFLIPLIGALSVVLVYFLGKKLFNKRVGVYSAIFLTFLPLHVVNSGKLLTGVLFTFFVLLVFISFWKGYEEENRSYKLLFGFFLALALLARYTALWIIPIFLIYFLIRDKSLKFLKDKYLWGAMGIFFLTLVPWFVYGLFEYNNLIGAFIHGAKASAYWGGIQQWYSFFLNWPTMFSIIGFIFVVGLIYIFYKKDFLKKEIYLLLIWFVFFLGIAIYMPHKENRFILAIVPVIVLISGYLMDKIKRYKKLILMGIIILIICFLQLAIHFGYVYNNSYTDTNKCFLEANKFLKNVEKDAVIITEESPIIYYYAKKETHFYPNPWSLISLRNMVETNYEGREVYIFFTDYDMPLNNDKHIQIKENLDVNFEKSFECYKDEAFSVIYRYS